MTVAQSLTAIIIFWAIIGGLGASLLLPAMQSLIHGNFEGAARKKAYALVGAAAAIAAAVGPLLGGFVTTYLSWRVGFALEVVIIAVVLSGIKLVRDVEYTGPRQIDMVGAALSVVGMGGVVLGILVWQEGGECGRACSWRSARSRSRCWPGGSSSASVRASRRCSTPTCSGSRTSGSGSARQMMQQITLGGAMIALPLFLQMTLEYNAMEAGLSLAPLSLSMFAVALLAGKKAGKRRPADIVLVGFALTHDRDRVDHPGDAPGRVRLVAPRAAPDRGIGAGPVGVAAQQLHAVTHRGGAGQRSRGRELRGGIVRAVVRTRDGRRPHARGPLARASRTWSTTAP